MVVRQFSQSENIPFDHWDIAADAIDLHEHDPPRRRCWKAVESEVFVTVNGQERRLGPGSAAVCLRAFPHSVKASAPAV